MSPQLLNSSFIQSKIDRHLKDKIFADKSLFVFAIKREK